MLLTIAQKDMCLPICDKNEGFESEVSLTRMSESSLRSLV